MRLFASACVCLLTLTHPLMGEDTRAPQDDTVGPGNEFCSNIRNTAFNAGESLTYKVSYVLAGVSLSGGEATFNTSLEKFQGKNVYHVIAEGKSYHDVLFKVRDKYETYIDTSTLQPYKFVRDVNGLIELVPGPVLIPHRT